jgi:hypothetical protein
MKHIHTHVDKLQFVGVRISGTYSYHWAVVKEGEGKM